MPQNFTRLNREDWERQGSKNLSDRVLQHYHSLMDKDNEYLLAEDLAGEVNSIVESADKKLVK
jgi:hypothetical protein